MKIFYIILAIALLEIIPMISATDIGQGIEMNLNIDPNNLTIGPVSPFIWMCGGRVTTDDNTENGLNGKSLDERKHNYAFEGESIHWNVLVLDLNGIDNIQEVVGTAGSVQGIGNNAEVDCKKVINSSSQIPESCAASVFGYQLTTFNPQIMSFYDCVLTIETPNSMHGKYFLTVEAKDNKGLSNTMDENEKWFLNPMIALSVYNNPVEFKNLIPGKISYSKTISIENSGEEGSGVILDTFISGTDFYDTTNNISFCPDPDRKLSLDKIKYFATNGAFSSINNIGADAEGYLPIPYSGDISGSKRIIRNDKCLAKYGYENLANATRGASPSSTIIDMDWNCGNTISPGSDMSLTFKVDAPGLCKGNFNDGQIYFWGEAI